MGSIACPSKETVNDKPNEHANKAKKVKRVILVLTNFI